MMVFYLCHSLFIYLFDFSGGVKCRGLGCLTMPGPPGSLGATAAAGWAAVPGAHHQLGWWRWLQVANSRPFATTINDDDEQCAN
jgi:hypothetical protein